MQQATSCADRLPKITHSPPRGASAVVDVSRWHSETSSPPRCERDFNVCDGS